MIVRTDRRSKRSTGYRGRWWIDHPAADVAISIAVSGSWRAGRALDWIPATATVEASTRLVAYQVVGTAAAVVLGLFVLPVTFLFGLNRGPRLLSLAQDEIGRLRRSVVAIGGFALASLAITFAAVAYDGENPGNVLIRTATLGSIVGLVLGIARVLVLVNITLALHEQDQTPTVADIIARNPVDYDEAMRP